MTVADGEPAPERDETADLRGQEPVLRTARPADGAAVWRLVGETGVLDRNSPYAYLLFLDHFGDTCIVAEADGRLLGFILAFRPPRRPHAVFVWQVAVAAAARGQGLGQRMLAALIRADGCHGVTHLEATVTPSNTASRALFLGFARRLRAAAEISPHYDRELFPEGGHEPEELFSIGPFNTISPMEPTP